MKYIIALILFMVTIPCMGMDLTKAVIHHTDSHDVSAEEIDRWHKERGWDGIGYHFVIRKNGAVEKGRPLTSKGAHARDRNHYIGIALTGKDEFTLAQGITFFSLLLELDITTIERHHEECPGKGLDVERFQEILTEVLTRED